MSAQSGPVSRAAKFLILLIFISALFGLFALGVSLACAPIVMLVQWLKPDPETTFIFEIIFFPVLILSYPVWDTLRSTMDESKVSQDDKFGTSWVAYTSTACLIVVLGTVIGGFTSSQNIHDSPWIIENRYQAREVTSTASRQIQVDTSGLPPLGTMGKWYPVENSGGHIQFENAALVGDELDFYIRLDSVIAYKWSNVEPGPGYFDVQLISPSGLVVWENKTCPFLQKGDGTPDVNVVDFTLSNLQPQPAFIRVIVPGNQ